MKTRARLLITGKVQGVFFRSSTMAKAKLYGLSGWVRNLPEGGVEAVAEGQREDIEKFIEFCKEGPPGSSVENVEVSWEMPTHKHKGFGIRA